MFIPIDNGTIQAGQGSTDSVSALGVRQFKSTLWEIGKKEIVATMLSEIYQHRNGNEDGDSVKFLERCKEILCVMGVVKAKNFSQIKNFINVQKANKGRYIVMPELPLLTDASGAAGDAESKVVVADHLEFYRDEFQEPFINASKVYFSQLSQDWFTSKTVPEYFAQFEAIFDEENKRIAKYLHESTKKILQKTCVQQLLENPIQERLLGTVDTCHEQTMGLFQLLKAKKLDEAARIFKCVKLVDDFKLKGGLKQVADIFAKFIQSEGRTLIRERVSRIDKLKAKYKKAGKKMKPQGGHDPDYVDRLRMLYNSAKSIRIKQFENKAEFNKSMTRAFQEIVNNDWGKESSQTDEFLVSYMNMLFHGKHLKTNINSDRMKELCGEILELFDMLNDKDRFLDTYKRMMVDRLLDPNYKEYTNETDVLAKLKLRMGGSETQSMESMLNDVTKVKMNTKQWLEHVASNAKVADDTKCFQPKVLNSTAWILPKVKVKMTIPHKVQMWREAYGRYYEMVQSSRTLWYRPDLSMVTLTAKFDKKYRVQMTAPQACVLLLFNDHPKLTIPKIQEHLQIKSSEAVSQVLLSLLIKPHSKYCKSGLLHKIRVKGVKPLPLTTADEFTLQEKFVHKFLKFEVKKPNYGYTAPPPPPPRNIRLEAALVRTMKANRTMETRDLINEAMAQVSSVFKPDVRDVKKVVEKLIKRAYMKRIDGGKLQYLA